MADNRQQIILLHGNSAFTTTSVSDLVKGELVIEHGADATKLHTLANDGSLATFATEADLKDYVKNGVETRVETLETTVGGEGSGLVKQVADNAAAIKDNADNIAELQAALGTGGDADNSITNRVQALETTVGKEAEGETPATGLVKKVDENASAIEALETTVGSADSGLVKQVADNTSAITAEVTRAKGEEGRIEGLVTAEVTRAKGEETRIEGLVTSNNAKLEDLTGRVSAAEKDIDDLQTAVKTTLPEEIAKAKTVVEVSGDFLEVTPAEDATDKHMTYTISTKGIAKATDVDDLNGKVTTLIGNDFNKSVRTIANEELAAQLIPSDAAESLNTLKEIADWIQDHPEDAAAMNTQITELQNTLAGYSSTDTVEAAITGVSSRVDALETTVGNADSGLVKDVADNADAIAEEKSRAEQKEGELNTAIEANAAAITAEVTARENAISGVTSKIEGVETRVETLETTAVKKISYKIKNDEGAEEVVELTPDDNGVVDLSGLVIDGGTY